MITLEEYLMGREKQWPLTLTQHENAIMLLSRVNQLSDPYGLPMIVSSGYRPAAINAQTAGAAKHSNHMACLAIDIADKNRTLKHFVMNNLPLMIAVGLWIEDPGSTPTWMHLQCVPPGSGRRVFIP